MNLTRLNGFQIVLCTFTATLTRWCKRARSWPRGSARLELARRRYVLNANTHVGNVNRLAATRTTRFILVSVLSLSSTKTTQRSEGCWEFHYFFQLFKVDLGMKTKQSNAVRRGASTVSRVIIQSRLTGNESYRRRRLKSPLKHFYKIEETSIKTCV